MGRGVSSRAIPGDGDSGRLCHSDRHAAAIPLRAVIHRAERSSCIKCDLSHSFPLLLTSSQLKKKKAFLDHKVAIFITTAHLDNTVF